MDSRSMDGQQYEVRMVDKQQRHRKPYLLCPQKGSDNGRDDAVYSILVLLLYWLSTSAAARMVSQPCTTSARRA